MWRYTLLILELGGERHEDPSGPLRSQPSLFDEFEPSETLSKEVDGISEEDSGIVLWPLRVCLHTPLCTCTHTHKNNELKTTYKIHRKQGNMHNV